MTPGTISIVSGPCNIEQGKSSLNESWRPETSSLSDKVSPAHRRVAVCATPFDANRHHRVLLFPFYGCHKTVLDRSTAHCIRSALGRDGFNRQWSNAIGSAIASADVWGRVGRATKRMQSNVETLSLCNGKDHATAENQINHAAGHTIRRSSCIRWLQAVRLRTRSIDVAQLPTKCGWNRKQGKSTKAGDQSHRSIRKLSPAHRRVAVRSTTPFDVNRQHRALLSEIYGCHKSVSDRSWQTTRSAAGRDISIGKRRTPSEVQSRQPMSRPACKTVSGLVEMKSSVELLSRVTVRITRRRQTNEPHRSNQPPPFVVHPLVTHIRCRPNRWTSPDSARSCSWKLRASESGRKPKRPEARVYPTVVAGASSSCRSFHSV